MQFQFRFNICTFLVAFITLLFRHLKLSADYYWIGIPMNESYDVKLYVKSDDQLEPLLDPKKQIEMSRLAGTHLVSDMFAHWGDQHVKK